MKRVFLIGGIILAVLVIILIALPFFLDVNSFRPKLESEMSDALGRQVKVGHLSLSLLAGNIAVDDVSIADDPAFSKTPFIQAKSLKIGIRLKPLIFQKQFEITGITLDQPELLLLRAPDGTWNFSNLGGKSSAAAPAAKPAEPSSAVNFSIASLIISNGRVTTGRTDLPSKRSIYDKVNLEIKDFTLTSKFPIKLAAILPGGGELQLDGAAGPIDPVDAAATPLEAKISINRFDLVGSGFVAPSAGIAGLVTLASNLKSDGHIAQANGTVKVENWKMAAKGAPAGRPLELKYAVDRNLKSESGTIKQGSISFGKAVANLTGNYQTQGAATLVKMALVGNGMPVDDLEAMLPALGLALPSGSKLQGGTLSGNLDINGPIEKLVITGPIRLADTRLSGFSMLSKLSAVLTFLGKSGGGNDTVIQNLSADLRYSLEGVKTDNVDLNVPSLGQVKGNGVISPDGVLNYQMIANLSESLAGKYGSVPFKVQGATSNPSFIVDSKALAGSAIKSILNPQPGQTSSPFDALGGLFGKKKK